VRYAVLAFLLAATGVALLYVEVHPERYTPIVRLRTDAGMFITFVQPGLFRRSECRATVDAFTATLGRSCPQCTVDSAGCHENLDGIDKALARNQVVPFHTVESKMFRVAVAGPPASVLSQCREIASQMARHGVEGSACREPLAKAKETGG
jgi:hypothetical protein